MADWKFLTLAFVVLGFEMDALAMANNNLGSTDSVVATEICGFICFVVALLLVVLVRFGELQGSKVVLIIITVFAIAAAILNLISLILYRDRVRRELPPYPTTLQVCGAAFGILAGVFAIVDVCKS